MGAVRAPESSILDNSRHTCLQSATARWVTHYQSSILTLARPHTHLHERMAAEPCSPVHPNKLPHRMTGCLGFCRWLLTIKLLAHCGKRSPVLAFSISTFQFQLCSAQAGLSLQLCQKNAKAKKSSWFFQLPALPIKDGAGLSTPLQDLAGNRELL